MYEKPLTDHEKIIRKQQKRLLQKAIPDEILQNMVDECLDDKIDVLEKAKTYRQEHADEILFVRWIAEKGILQEHGYLKNIKETNKNTLSNIGKIIKFSTKLRALLPETSDLLNANTSDTPELGIAMRLNMQFSCVENTQDYQNRDYSAYDTKLEDWPTFLSLLDHHISVWVMPS